jgi:hypothetical protein
LNFRYKSIGKQTGSGVFEYFENQISKLPIPKVSSGQQESLAEKVDEMIKLSKQLYEKAANNANYIKSKFNIEKLSQKLENHYLLGGNQFLEELAKVKVKLEMKQEQELLKWFEDTKTELSELTHKIKTLDRTIDKEVYTLYKLTPEEIAIMEWV